MVAVAIGGAALIGGAASVIGSNEAADAQADAAARAAQISEEQYRQTREDLAPYREGGQRGLDEMLALYGLNGEDAQQAAWGRFRTDPGYQFGLDEGLRAVQGSAAARSSGLGGGALKSLQRYGQGYADQQYGNYLTRLQNLGTMGQNSAAQTGTFGMQSAQQQGQAWGDYGAARAGGALATSGAINDSLSGALKNYGYAYGKGWI